MNKLFLLTAIILCANLKLNAQVFDDFSDGDFTNNPTWIGDSSSWTIINEELRSNDTLTNRSFVLATPNSLINNTEWRCKLRLLFSTSGANYVDIFVVADTSALASTTVNGYFVRVGGTPDEISLFKKTGSTSVKIIDGIDGRSQFSTSNNTILINLTRSSSGLWTLRSDNNDGQGWVTEGDTVDFGFTSTSWFGFLVRQSTASFFLKHFIDDVSVGPIPVDSIAPFVQNITVPNDSTVLVNFSEAVQLNGNYTLTPGGVVPSSRALAGVGIVDLRFAAPFTPGQPYTISISGVSDIAGNPMDSAQSFSFTWTPPFVPGFKDLVINEILADPTPVVGLPNAEFVEIYNPTSQSIDLQGYRFSDPGATGVIGSSFSLGPQSYVILCPSSAVAQFQTFGNVIGLSPWPTLNNDRDSLWLRRPDGTLIDEVAYSNTWYASSVKRDGGWSLELINPFTPCSESNNWAESVNSTGGTPGSQNSVFNTAPDTTPPQVAQAALQTVVNLTISFSEPLDTALLGSGLITINGVNALSVQLASGSKSNLQVIPPAFVQAGQLYGLEISNFRDCSGNLMIPFASQVGIGELPLAGDIIFTEIMADESPQVGQPLSEYIELHNRSSKILELGGVQLADQSVQRALPSALLLPDSFVVLIPSGNTALFAQTTYKKLSPQSWISLTNSGKELRLINQLSDEIDKVVYADTWYGDPVKKDGGWSLELINPTLPCSGSFNWTASNDPSGGTPGALNSVWNTEADTVKPSLLEAGVFGSNGVELFLSEPIGSNFVNTIVIQANPSLGSYAVSLDPNSNEKLIIQFSDSLVQGIIYNLVVAGVADCSGNVADSIALSVGIGESPKFHDLIITEIFADETPQIGLPNGEFVEIKNNSNTLINTSGCVFTDGSSFGRLQVATLLPGERVILCPSARVPDFRALTNARVFGLSSWPSLTNAGKTIYLLGDEGQLLHVVNYSDTWYNDAVKKDGGWTLEMIDESFPCVGLANWSASIDPRGGTPGAVNSVRNTNPDLRPPSLLRGDVVSSKSIQLSFDEILDSISARQASIILSTEQGTALGVAGIESTWPLKTSFIIQLADSLAIKNNYLLSVSGLKDCAGNAAPTLEISVVVPEQALKGDLVINEVLFNPPTGGRDFVEIYNRSEKPINLQNWSLANVQEDTLANFRTATTQPYILRPKQFATLTTSGQLVQRDYPAFRIETLIEMSSLPSYNNDAGTVVLINNLAEVMDSFPYTEDMHFRLLDDVKGFSLEKINFDRPSFRSDSWKSASSSIRATPGYQNSQFTLLEGTSGEVAISPPSFTPDGDGVRDLCIISYQFGSAGNVANITIFDQQGREMKVIERSALLGTSGEFFWDGTTESGEKARVGTYLILFEVFDLNGNTQTFKKTTALGAIFR